MIRHILVSGIYGFCSVIFFPYYWYYFMGKLFFTNIYCHWWNCEIFLKWFHYFSGYEAASIELPLRNFSHRHYGIITSSSISSKATPTHGINTLQQCMNTPIKNYVSFQTLTPRHYKRILRRIQKKILTIIVNGSISIKRNSNIILSVHYEND